jgi:hypothetical protein
MPQIQIPDGIRPALALLRKYHFWMLAALLPLVLVPLLFAATGGLQAEIAKRQGEIKGKISAVQGVKSIEPHPNEAWSTAIDAEAAGVRRETLTEWETFWESQRFLRVWPKELGDDFLEQIAALKPDGDLRRPMLQRYQNKISDIVKKLPARMGADEQMGQGAGPGDGVV